MKAKTVLTSLGQLKAFADPLRFKILEELIGAELPITGLAQALNVPPTRLYHHVDLLLEAGLVHVARQVRRRGVEERVFRAVARQYTLAGNLLALSPRDPSGGERVLPLVRSVLGGALDEVVDGIKSGRVEPSKRGKGLVLESRTLRLSTGGFQSLADEFPAWIASFQRRHRSARSAPYRLVFAAFPKTTLARKGGQHRRLS